MRIGWNALIAPGSLLIVLSALACATAGDWPQWRGPGRDGRADPADLPAHWPESLQPVWRLAIGEGHSSPIVADGRVYAFSRQGGREAARAMDFSTGDVLWSAGYEAPYTAHNAARDHGAGPKSTPIIAEGRLFTVGISGILSCFDAAEGSVVWRKEFSDRFEKTSPLYGAAASPLLIDGRLIVHVGGHDDGALIAFDAADGREIWSWDGDGPGYTSPVLLEGGGVRQLVTQSQTALIGNDPETGRLLWRVPFRTPYDQNSISPLVHASLLIYGGFQQPTVAVRLSPQGDTWQLDEVWKNGDIPVYMSTPVVAGDLLFGFTHRNRGQLFCAAASTGKVHWSGAGRAGDNAALIAAGDLILAQFTTGELHVLKATAAAPAIVARYRVSESPTWAHPAIAAGRLLTKDAETLTCWRLR